VEGDQGDFVAGLSLVRNCSDWLINVLSRFHGTGDKEEGRE
jgi:hypothetical protein